MALSTLLELFTETTVEAIKGTLYGYLTAAKLPVRAWQALSPTRVLTDAQARLQQATQVVVVALAKSAFLDTATGEWLKQRVREQFDVTPIEDTFALGEFVANNTGGGSYSFLARELTFTKIGTRFTYHNLNPVSIGALETGVSIEIEADEAGAASSAAPDQIELTTSVLGVTGTNQLAVTGLDQEETDALRARARASRGALSPHGPRDAYEYVAKTPELNGGVIVGRQRLLPPTGDGLVTVVVAGPLGPLSLTELQLIQNGIDEWAVSATALATVVSAGEVPQAIAARVWVPLIGSPNLIDLAAAIKKDLIAYINKLPIGGVQLSPGFGVVPWSGVLSAIKQTVLGVDTDGKPYRPILAVDLIGSGEVDVPVGGTEIATLVEASITLEFQTVNA